MDPEKKKNSSNFPILLFVLIILALSLSPFSSCYIKRGIMGRLKEASDDIGRQFKEREAQTPNPLPMNSEQKK